MRRAHEVAWILALCALPLGGCSAGGSRGGGAGSGAGAGASAGAGAGAGSSAGGAVGSSVDASTPVFFDASPGGFDGDLDALLGLLDEQPIDLSGATGSCAALRTCCGAISSAFDRVSCKAIVQEGDQAQCQLGLTDFEKAALCP